MLAGSEATIGLVLLVAVVAAVVVVTVRVARSEDSKVSNRMLEALQGAPLFRMLERSGVDALAYAQAADAILIRRQIATCESCTSARLCDTALDSGAEALADLSFCPNEAAIAQAKRAVSSSHTSR